MKSDHNPISTSDQTDESGPNALRGRTVFKTTKSEHSFQKTSDSSSSELGLNQQRSRTKPCHDLELNTPLRITAEHELRPAADFLGLLFTSSTLRSEMRKHGSDFTSRSYRSPSPAFLRNSRVFILLSPLPRSLDLFACVARWSEAPHVPTHISCHPSLICFETCYREYMVYSLPHLKVLDNLHIKKSEREKAQVVFKKITHLKVLDNLHIKNSEREKAQVVFKKYFEYFPYNRQSKENIISILQKREMGHTTAFQKPLLSKQTYSRESCHSFSRSLSAAKVGSSPWPQMLSVSKLKSHSSEDTKMFRPRQFEYHPTNPSLMVFGTLDGELLVINHESQKLVGYLPSVGTLDSIIGLCWLKKYPSKLIAGSDNGSLQLYDICQMPSTVIDRYSSMDISRNTFDEFEQLTSVHINSTDEYFLASGFSKHVALYDISSGKRLQILKDLHQEHINVVKFAHYSPSIFATASFDRDVKMWDLRQGMKQPCFTATSLRGNVMACFSPDDHYLLTSAIDNEVKQLLAVDGRLHTEFHIAPTGSSQNYTRSYYMNGKDYIISGSCEENSVRICCAQTGRRFRDLPLESGGPGFSMFVQSLRGDPFRMFHMSILAAYLHPCTKSEIIKVNLLASSDSAEEDSYAQCLHAPSGMGS